MTTPGGIATIELSWPARVLWPNKRTHFRAKADATRAYRQEAYWRTVNAQAAACPADGEIVLRFEFFPPDRIRRDLDNMFASTKGAIDGIADALGVDDQRFGYQVARRDVAKGGKVIVSVGCVNLVDTPVAGA